MADDFFKRRIPPMVDAWKLADELVAQSQTLQNLSATERVNKIDAACRGACKKIINDEDFAGSQCHYDTYDRPIYKPKFESGHPQQINVKVGGEFLDIASISPIVASAATFNIHRVYYNERTEGMASLLDTKLRDAIADELSQN